MPNAYHHLSAEERAVIMIEHAQGVSASAIARRLGRNRSTITRELKHQDPEESYCATQAARGYRQRRALSVRKRKLTEGSALFGKVHDMLRYRQWSPEQISERLKVQYPDEAHMQVSHETIYAAIYAYPKNELRRVFIDELRQAKPKRGCRSKTTRYATIQVPDSMTIHQRGEEIASREVAGHWEGDLIVGKLNKSCIGTVVERKTGFLVLCKMDDKSARSVREGFERQFKKIDRFLRLSMTYDRGSEMAEHPLMSKRLNMDIYFADPHAPWQRGSNENTNGLLRQYFPKGTDLSEISQVHLNDVAWLLNTRPRKRFGFRTPQELFDEAIAKHINSVALDS